MNPIARWLRKRRWRREYLALVKSVGDDPLVRVQDHIKRLDEYFMRWLGFCKLDSSASPQFLTDNALFLVLESASNVAQDDVVRLHLPEKEALVLVWQDYLHSLANLRNCQKSILPEAENSYLKLKSFAERLKNKPKRLGDILG